MYRFATLPGGPTPASYLDSNFDEVINGIQLQKYIIAVSVGGSANAITATTDPSVIPSNGMLIALYPASTNTSGNVTLAVNGDTARQVRVFGRNGLFGYGQYGLIPGNIRAGSLHYFYYKNGEWYLINPFDPFPKYYWAKDDSTVANSIVLSTIPEVNPENPDFKLNGLTVIAKIAYTNTSSAVTLSINGSVALNVYRNDGLTLEIENIKSGLYHVFIYDNGAWYLVNPYDGKRNYYLASDLSTGANTIVLQTSPKVAPFNGLTVIAKILYSNTSTTVTLNLNQTGAVAVERNDGLSLNIGDVRAGTVHMFIYQDSKWKLDNPATGKTSLVKDYSPPAGLSSIVITGLDTDVDHSYIVDAYLNITAPTSIKMDVSADGTTWYNVFEILNSYAVNLASRIVGNVNVIVPYQLNYGTYQDNCPVFSISRVTQIRFTTVSATFQTSTRIRIYKVKL